MRWRRRWDWRDGLRVLHRPGACGRSGTSRSGSAGYAKGCGREDVERGRRSTERRINTRGIVECAVSVMHMGSIHIQASVGVLRSTWRREEEAYLASGAREEGGQPTGPRGGDSALSLACIVERVNYVNVEGSAAREGRT